jgi:hypothetical protein
MDTLFSLTEEYQQLLDLASSMDPEDEQTFKDTMEGVLGEIDHKADGYCAVQTQLKGRITVIEQEIDRLTALKSTIENHIKAMNNALMASMDITGRTEIKTDLHKIKVVNNGGKLPLKIDGIVPDEFTKTEIKVSPDNDKIREALDAGQELPFAHYGERGRHLNIK